MTSTNRPTMLTMGNGIGVMKGRPDCQGNWACDLNNVVGTAGDVAWDNGPDVAVAAGVWGVCTLLTAGAGAVPCAVLVAGGIGGYYGGTAAQNFVGNVQGGEDPFKDLLRGANLHDYSVSVAVPVVGKFVTAIDPLHDAVSSNGVTAFFGDLINQATSGNGHVNFCQSAITAGITAASSREGLPAEGLPGAVFGAMTGIANTVANMTAGVCK